MFSKTFQIKSENIREQVLNKINTQDIGILLDFGVNHEHHENANFRAAIGCHSQCAFNPGSSEFQDWFIQQHQEIGNRIYGFFTYDTKNLIENLYSENKLSVEFPIYHLFVPEVEFFKSGQNLTITSQSNNIEEIWLQLNSISSGNSLNETSKNGVVSSLNKEVYLKNVQKILEHIQRGDVYELNYCHEITISDFQVNPTRLALKLNRISPNPYSSYYKLNKKYLFCSSPEGFLKKQNRKLVSTPIKGTAPRSDIKSKDEDLKADLIKSEKERAENVMIVDLVRNDFSKIAKKGTVSVDELFGIYSFSHSHQMISTISCELNNDISFFDIIKATFPMGSMTGAPKVRAMQLIEELENFKRGLFSGTVGFIEPNGDFEFNVVIRSILYDDDKNTVSLAAGGAITASSIPEKEYEETILKLTPQLMALGIDVKQELNPYLINNA